LEYSAKDAYNLTDMSATSWEQVGKKLLTDDHTFATFSKYYNALADDGNFCGSNAGCRKDAHCSSLWIRDYFYDKCMRESN
jgi:flagellum-specific peptidoglycan hydrolase FlgJ